jgi:hypothetical protein
MLCVRNELFNSNIFSFSSLFMHFSDTGNQGCTKIEEILTPWVTLHHKETGYWPNSWRRSPNYFIRSEKLSDWLRGFPFMGHIHPYNKIPPMDPIESSHILTSCFSKNIYIIHKSPADEFPRGWVVSTIFIPWLGVVQNCRSAFCILRESLTVLPQ